jgi:hypothetical protein
MAMQDRLDDILQSRSLPDDLVAVMPESADERHRLPAAKWSSALHARLARTPSAQRRHVGLRPRLVDENQALRIDTPLILLPLFTPPGDVGPVLLLGEHAFFYS